MSFYFTINLITLIKRLILFFKRVSFQHFHLKFWKLHAFAYIYEIKWLDKIIEWNLFNVTSWKIVKKHMWGKSTS